MQTDRVLRAMTDDGAFRVMTIRSTDTTQQVANAQRVAGSAASHLGELVTAAILVRETMSPGKRAQIVLRAANGDQLVGDSWPEGNTRGLAQLEDDVLGPDLSTEGGLLQVTRIMHGGKPHQGTVEIGVDGGVAKAVMTYFQQSEQIVSMVALGCLTEDDQVRAAGGFVVQLLPEVTEPPLAIMTERLRDFEELGPRLRDTDADPQDLMRELLYGFSYTELAESDVRFHCHCSYERVLGGVAALGREDLEEMIANRETAKVTCDFCGERYEVGIEALQQIVDSQPPTA